MSTMPILRVARPSDDLQALLPFYQQGLGLTLLYRFEDHDGFDGVMLGHETAPYHFEFTKARGHQAGRAPPETTCSSSISRRRRSGRRPSDGCATRASRPFRRSTHIGIATAWRSRIPDGYRVVLQQAAWTR